MKHPETRTRLSEYLERDLDSEARSGVETHLESCASCRSDLDALRSTVSLLRRLPEPPQPLGLADAVMARVAQDARAPAPVRSLVWRRLAEPRFAAALAAGLAGFFLLFQSDGAKPGTQSLATEQPGPVASWLEAELELAGAWSGASHVRAGVRSGATPAGAYPGYASRAKLEEMARQLRGAAHPFSESLAAHFEAQPTVVRADWQPR